MNTVLTILFYLLVMSNAIGLIVYLIFFLFLYIEVNKVFLIRIKLFGFIFSKTRPFCVHVYNCKTSSGQFMDVG